jgi:hypothetical protein
MSRYLRPPSPSLIVALVALFVALSSGAAAGTVLASTHARASTASADSRSSQSIPLARRVTALEKKVKALQTQATVTQAVVGGLTFWSVCSAVTTADALQGTWQTIDELSAATQAGKTYFGPQTRVDDTVAGKHACTLTRVGRSWAVPPSVTSFNYLLRVLR